MMRWSCIWIASAPALHNALRTAWMSCWCTTRSSGDASRGKRPLASRCASLSVTVRPGPCTGSSPASPASSADRRCIAASAASGNRPCVESMVLASRSRSVVRCSTADRSLRTRSTSRGASLRLISPPRDTPWVAPSSSPANKHTTGTPTRHGDGLDPASRPSRAESSRGMRIAIGSPSAAGECVTLVVALALHTVAPRFPRGRNAQVQSPQEERLHR